MLIETSRLKTSSSSQPDRSLRTRSKLDYCIPSGTAADGDLGRCKRVLSGSTKLMIFRRFGVDEGLGGLGSVGAVCLNGRGWDVREIKC